MFTKHVSLMLILALLGGEVAVAGTNGKQDASRTSAAQQQTAPATQTETAPDTDESQRAEEVRSEIRKLGTGPDAQIKLKLRDKTKVQGFISEAGDDSFVVTNLKTGVATTVAYPQVGTAKGNNLSEGAKIVIGVGVSIGLTILLYKYGRRRRRRF